MAVSRPATLPHAGPLLPLDRVALDADAAAALMPRQLALVDSYRWVCDSRMTRFFREGFWERLPRAWQDALHGAPADRLGRLLLPRDMHGSEGDTDVSEQPDTGEPWPLSLLAFAAACRAATVARSPARCKASAASIDRPLRSGVTPKKAHEIAALVPLVRALAEAASAARGARALVVDIGAGQSYLAAALAYAYGGAGAGAAEAAAMLGRLDVVALEMDAANVEAARKRALIALRQLDRAERDGRRAPAPGTASGGALAHGTWQLGVDATSADLLRAIAEARGLEGEPGDSRHQPPLVLVCLHGCGDLSSRVLRLARDTAAVQAVLVVGCCYMRATEGGAAHADGPGAGAPPAPAPGRATPDAPSEGERGDVGYPLSLAAEGCAGRAGRRLSSALGWSARELACHEAERYAAQLSREDAGAPPRLHGYRAAFEVLLHALDEADGGAAAGAPASDDGSTARPARRRLGSPRACVDAAAAGDFDAYVRAAMNAIGMGWHPLASESGGVDGLGARALERARACAAQWRRARAFFCLRLALAPVIESVILADRCHFLQHGGLECAAEHAPGAPPGDAWAVGGAPVFEPTISPRNFALVGVRQQASGSGTREGGGGPSAPERSGGEEATRRESRPQPQPGSTADRPGPPSDRRSPDGVGSSDATRRSDSEAPHSQLASQLASARVQLQATTLGGQAGAAGRRQREQQTQQRVVHVGRMWTTVGGTKASSRGVPMGVGRSSSASSSSRGSSSADDDDDD